ncbi:MAG TPA: surface-adhesin E family protein [Stenomitos sp.]
MTTILEFLIAANGDAQLCASDGQFLGKLSSQHDENSIINPNSPYGNPLSVNCIKNSVSPYGGASGQYSPYNLTCLNPPIILHQSQPIMAVTRNCYAQTNGLSIVDPDFLLGLLFGMYAQLSNATPNPGASSIVPNFPEKYGNQFSTPKLNLVNIPNPSGQWVYVTTDVVNGDEIAIDTISAIKQGNIVRVWQRRLHSVPDQQDTKIALMYLSIDCSTGIYRLEKDIYLNSLGIVTGGSNEPGSLQNTIPGSVGGAVFQFVCQF